MRVFRLMKRIAFGLERRPWSLAAAYFLSELLTYLTLAVLFVNHCPSRNRFVPEMSDEFAAGVCDVYDFSLKLTVVVGGIMLLVPLMPLFYRRYRTVVVMLTLGVVVMVAGTKALDLVPWSCRSALAEQMRVVRLNVERKKEAQRQGKTECLRVPVHKFVRRRWLLGNGRYEIYQLDNTVKKGVYCLSDNKWRQDRYQKDLWEDKVLADEIVRWNDCKDHLYFVKVSGEGYVLDYVTGTITPFTTGGRE